MALRLEAAARENEKAAKLLKKGCIPAIVYGPGHENVEIQMSESVFVSLLHMAKETTPVHLTIADKGEKDVFIKSVQFHKMSGKVIHVDFYEPEPGKSMHFKLPIEFVGEAKGVSAGGILDELVREISVEALPKDIIEEIKVDISDVEVGDALRIKDLPIPENFKILENLDEVVLTIKAPRGEEIPEEGEEEITEPEAIKTKGTSEEENA